MYRAIQLVLIIVVLLLTIPGEVAAEYTEKQIGTAIHKAMAANDLKAAKELTDFYRNNFSPEPPTTDQYAQALKAYQNEAYITARALWEPIAQRGDALGQYYLGLMYTNGSGVLKNYKIAVQWHTLAAEQGLSFSQTKLGTAYLIGTGIPRDYIYAHMWLNLGIANGDEGDALKTMGITERVMTPSQIAEAQKLARECVAKNYKGC